MNRIPDLNEVLWWWHEGIKGEPIKVTFKNVASSRTYRELGFITVEPSDELFNKERVSTKIMGPVTNGVLFNDSTGLLVIGVKIDDVMVNIVRVITNTKYGEKTVVVLLENLFDTLEGAKMARKKNIGSSCGCQTPNKKSK